MYRTLTSSYDIFKRHNNNMDQRVSSDVTEKVQTIDRVGQAVRVFLAGAIVLGFGASAMGFLILPELIDGGNQTTLTKRASPLRVADVTGAVSVLDAHQEFSTLNYIAGSQTVFSQTTLTGEGGDALPGTNRNQNLSIRRAVQTSSADTPAGGGAIRATFGIPTARAQATSFSVEPIPPVGIAGQIVTLRYRLAGDPTERTLTLCLGQTESNTVYVSTDGSTYTDSKLTKRTTSATCPSIQSRAMKTTDVVKAKLMPHPKQTMYENETIMNWDAVNVTLARSNTVLARKAPGGFTLMENGDDASFEDGQIVTAGNDPLQIYHEGGVMPYYSGSGEYNRTIDVTESILEIYSTPDISVATAKLCVPGAYFVEGVSNQKFFYDREGTPYLDIFLTDRATPAACPSILSRVYAPNRLQSVSWSQTLGPDRGLWIQGAFWHYGVMYEDTWYDRQDGNNPAEGYSVDGLGTVILLTGNRSECTFATATCTATRPGSGSGPTPEAARQAARSFCFGKIACNGNPLNSCYDNGELAAPLELRYSGYVEELNSLTDGVYTSYGRCESNQTYTVSTPTPFAVPATTLSLTDDAGETVHACYPGDPDARWNLFEHMYFYDRQGKPYQDLFLAEPVACSAPVATTVPPPDPAPTPLPTDHSLIPEQEILKIQKPE